jgi:hypothetical protein
MIPDGMAIRNLVAMAPYREIILNLDNGIEPLGGSG